VKNKGGNKMGMYTEFIFAVELEKSTPKNVIEILQYMANHENDMPELPQHEFFKCDRWDFLLSCDSCYFSGITNSIIEFDDIIKRHFLTVRSNLKNYDGEIRKFLSWLKPYINDKDHSFLGYFRYEEDDEPNLIYYDEIE
jgi:transcription termination factor NusB